MDDSYFMELDQQDLERVEEENEAPPGPDEAEEAPDSVRVVKPKKIIVKPRLKLDGRRLKGPRGLTVLEPLFKNVVLKGPGYERKDLDTILASLEHWAHRLFPKMTFDDCLEKIEELGHKVTVSNYVSQIRMGCAETAENDINDEQPIISRSPSPQPTVDPFDQLLDNPAQSKLTQEQRERMERNQLIALERRRARLKAKYEKANSSALNDPISNSISGHFNTDKSESNFNSSENLVSGQDISTTVNSFPEDCDKNSHLDLKSNEPTFKDSDNKINYDYEISNPVVQPESLSQDDV